MIVRKKTEQKGFQQLTAAIRALKKKKLGLGVAMALVCYTQRENGD